MTATLSVRAALSDATRVGQNISVRGWLRSRRDSKAGLSFLAINDGSCLASIQAVVPAALPNYASEVLQLSSGCAVVVSGELAASQGKGQALEIQAHSVAVLGWVDDPETYPIAKKRHSFEYLRTVAHLRPRTNALGAIARVRSSLSFAVHRFFHERGFFYVHTPIITASDCEGAGAMFRVSTLDPDKPPENWDQFYDYCQKLTIPEKGQWGFAFEASPSGTAFHWIDLLWQAGGDVVAQDKSGQWRCVFNSPAGVTAVKIRRDRCETPVCTVKFLMKECSAGTNPRSSNTAGRSSRANW